MDQDVVSGAAVKFVVAGDDILIGGKGSDILFGGPGRDSFVIEFLSGAPDEIMDFRPEEGDTLSLSDADAEQLEGSIKRFRINRKGVVTYQFIGGKEIEAVKLNRHDLSLEDDPVGKGIRLNLSVRF